MLKKRVTELWCFLCDIQKQAYYLVEFDLSLHVNLSKSQTIVHK